MEINKILQFLKRKSDENNTLISIEKCIQPCSFDVDIIELAEISNNNINSSVNTKTSTVKKYHKNGLGFHLIDENNKIVNEGIKNIKPINYIIKLEENNEVKELNLFGWFLSANKCYRFSSSFYFDGIPDNINSLLCNKANILNSGVRIESGVYQPGFKGQIKGVIYTQDSDVFISYGSRIAQMIFNDTESKNRYNGSLQEKNEIIPINNIFISPIL